LHYLYLLSHLESDSNIKHKKKLVFDSSSGSQTPTSSQNHEDRTNFSQKRNKRGLEEDSNPFEDQTNGKSEAYVDLTDTSRGKKRTKVTNNSQKEESFTKKKEERGYYSNLPIDSPSICSTSFSGRRTFIRLENHESLSVDSHKFRVRPFSLFSHSHGSNSISTKRAGKLLSTPISFLLDNLNTEVNHTLQ
jgi:hypothetical protein